MASIFQCYHSPHLSLPLLHMAHKTEKQISSSMWMVTKQLLIQSLYLQYVLPRKPSGRQTSVFLFQGLYENTSQAVIKQYAVITPDTGKFDMIIKHKMVGITAKQIYLVSILKESDLTIRGLRANNTLENLLICYSLILLLLCMKYI